MEITLELNGVSRTLECQVHESLSRVLRREGMVSEIGRASCRERV